MNTKYFFIGLSLCLLISSCSSLKHSPSSEPVPAVSKEMSAIVPITTTDISSIHYELLLSGNNAKNSIEQIIREQNQLENLYSILFNNQVQAPKIDFSRKAVIVLTCGPFNTGGYSIEIISAIKTGNSIELVWGVKTPEPLDIVTQAITRPYGIFSVDAEPSDSILIKCN